MSNYIPNQDNYEDLANAIIIQAASDYRSAYRTYKKGSRSASIQIDRLERFFESDWAALLCRDKAKDILKRLQNEQLEKNKKPRKAVKILPRRY